MIIQRTYGMMNNNIVYGYEYKSQDWGFDFGSIKG
jgi:hypothetical protein